MRYLKNSFLLVLITAGFSACYYDVEERLYPAAFCDTTAVSFTSDIKPVIQRSCLLSGCHDGASAAGGIILDGYANVKAHINEARFMGSLTLDSKYSPMPKNAGQLNSCELSVINQWRLNGAPNN